MHNSSPSFQIGSTSLDLCKLPGLALESFDETAVSSERGDKELLCSLEIGVQVKIENISSLDRCHLLGFWLCM